VTAYRAGELVQVQRVWYAGPEPMMVPATLADFECRHGRIGDCKVCDLPLTLASRDPAVCAECGHLHFYGITLGYGECPIEGCDCAAGDLP
jgi:hypothetical protein